MEVWAANNLTFPTIVQQLLHIISGYVIGSFGTFYRPISLIPVSQLVFNFSLNKPPLSWAFIGCCWLLPVGCVLCSEISHAACSWVELLKLLISIKIIEIFIRLTIVDRPRINIDYIPWPCIARIDLRRCDEEGGEKGSFHSGRFTNFWLAHSSTLVHFGTIFLWFLTNGKLINRCLRIIIPLRRHNYLYWLLYVYPRCMIVYFARPTHPSQSTYAKECTVSEIIPPSLKCTSG